MTAFSAVLPFRFGSRFASALPVLQATELVEPRPPVHCKLLYNVLYIFSPFTEGKLKGPNLAAEAGQGLLQAVTSYASGDMRGVLRSAIAFVKTATGTIKADKLSKATKTSPTDCVS